MYFGVQETAEYLLVKYETFDKAIKYASNNKYINKNKERYGFWCDVLDTLRLNKIKEITKKLKDGDSQNL